MRRLLMQKYIYDNGEGKRMYLTRSLTTYSVCSKQLDKQQTEVNSIWLKRFSDHKSKYFIHSNTFE